MSFLGLQGDMKVQYTYQHLHGYRYFKVDYLRPKFSKTQKSLILEANGEYQDLL
jgi:hypothetical protein